MGRTAHVPSHLQEQGRLADAGVAAHKHDHARQHPTPEHAIELFDTSRPTLRLIGADVGDRQRPRRGKVPSPMGALPFPRRAFFGEAAPLRTLRASA
jgi:hypothetical protein